MLLFDTNFLFWIKSLLTFGLPLPDLILDVPPLHVSSLHYIVDLQCTFKRFGGYQT